MLRTAEPSIQSLLLVATVNDQVLGTATGFVVEYGERPYLITNYHVACGRNPDGGQPIHRSGAVPDALNVFYLLPQVNNQIRWEPRKEPVLDSEGRALWLEHPTHGRRVDVVAVPLRNHSGADLRPYSLDEPERRAQVGPSSDVSVIGFPFGLTGGGAFGIWTRGFIASEPDVDFNDLPCFLVDARARAGQSGSPVIAYVTWGPTTLANGQTRIIKGPGGVVNLLGVYSGRINEQSDLGRVWKVEALREILKGQKLGRAGL